jgi:hypothetical protein
METVLEKEEELKMSVDPAEAPAETGFIVVSGCPRSGTSLTMKIHRAMYGEDRILGAEFPQEQRRREFEEEIDEADEITDNTTRRDLRDYFRDKQEKMRARDMSKAERDYHDMNPGGFWECAFSVRGMFYMPFMKDELKAAEDDWRIVKVVSQGLLSSDPKLISKMVFLLRHPRAVAKSQERLVRELNVQGDDGEVHNLFDKFVIHTPEMFIQVTLQAMRFLLENRDIPFLLVNYEDILAKPEETIKKIYDFNNVPGLLTQGIAQVDQNLNRSSKAESMENELWPDAEYVYDAMLDFKELVEAGFQEQAYNRLEIALKTMSDPRRPIHKKNNNWMCFRAKKQTNQASCEQCMMNPSYRANLRAQSEAQEGQIAEYWRREPCVFECGLDVERKKYLTIEESKLNNFFAHDMPMDLEALRAEE